ncbi:MAG TPA: class II aldolase/adducin family protein [Spongiibacteraceae bacterium]|jgi:L-fuculose-phosphate aldolase|nr:class II aldolase/adducin family protein [Spongiibacteraceae bacterium]
MSVQTLIDTARRMHAGGLSAGSTGNLSLRTAKGMLISSSGSRLESLNTAQVVAIALNGDLEPGQAAAPSSEWSLHAAIYRARADVGAIVHCHSRYATALACCRRGIPAFHYMLEALGGPMACSDYALFGTPALATATVAALGQRQACLLANHGQVAVGKNSEEALQNAQLLEELAAQYWASLAIGGPVLLDDEQMSDVAKRFESYGDRSKP